jgi:hypothetical protein
MADNNIEQLSELVGSIVVEIGKRTRYATKEQYPSSYIADQKKELRGDIAQIYSLATALLAICEGTIESLNWPYSHERTHETHYHYSEQPTLMRRPKEKDILAPRG